MTSYDDQVKAAEQALARLRQDQEDAVFTTALPIRTIATVVNGVQTEVKKVPIAAPCTNCGQPSTTISKLINGEMVYRNERLYDRYTRSFRPLCHTCRERSDWGNDRQCSCRRTRGLDLDCSIHGDAC